MASAVSLRYATFIGPPEKILHALQLLSGTAAVDASYSNVIFTGELSKEDIEKALRISPEENENHSSWSVV